MYKVTGFCPGGATATFEGGGGSVRLFCPEGASIAAAATINATRVIAVTIINILVRLCEKCRGGVRSQRPETLKDSHGARYAACWKRRQNANRRRKAPIGRQKLRLSGVAAGEARIRNFD